MVVVACNSAQNECVQIVKVKASVWKKRAHPASNESNFENVKDETDSSATHWSL